MSLLRSLLQPRTVAVAVDAKAEGDASGIAERVIAHLAAKPPAGGFFVVSTPPGGKAKTRAASTSAVAGDWKDLPVVPDLAIVCTGAKTAADALDRAGSRGVRTAVICTEDPDGRASGTPLKRALLDAARRHGCRFVGPGSAGVNLPAAGLDASWIEDRPPAGRLALVTQSSTIAASVAGWAASRGIGMSRIVTVGDEADLGIDAVLDALAADTRTQAILLHVHALANGRAFMTSARAAARVKPILVLRPPYVMAGAQAPEADREAILDAAFARAGMLRVDDTAEWFAAAASLVRPIARRGGRFAVVSNGRGPAVLAAAAAAREGLLAPLAEKTVARLREALPSVRGIANPLVLPQDASAEQYGHALAALRDDPGIASVAVVRSPAPPSSVSAFADAGLASAIAASIRGSDVQVSACWFGSQPDDAARAALAAANVALHALPEEAAQAFVHRERHRRNQETLRQVPATQRQQIIADEHGGHEHALMTRDETESEAFLAAYGTLLRATQSEASSLDAKGRDAVFHAFGLRTPQPGAARAAVPLAFAIRNDPDFGRIVAVDACGVRAFALPPLNRDLTRDLAAAAAARIRAGTGIALAAEAIQDAAIRLADLACDLQEVVGLEARCVGVDGQGLVLDPSDMRVEAPARVGDHLSIHPYPRELEERVRAKDGREMLLRPIRIGDVRLYREMLDRIPQDDLFLRFCNRFSDIAQAIPTDLLANLVRFDYSRDMTFVALVADAGGRPEALGVVDAFVSPGGEEAEFSILVRTDLAGAGLGKTLMHKIIEYCRSRGVTTLYGLVLRKNPRMLGLAKRLGFERVQDDEEDEDMVKVVLPL